jgi:outer membrane protein TolC
MKQTLIILVLATVFSVGGLWAQEEDTLVYRYRRMAVEYQQQIKMAESRLSGAESMLEAAKSDRLPKLDFSGSYKYYGVPLKLAPPADAPAGTPGEDLHNRYSLDLMLSQPILTGGYLKNTQLAAMSQVELMKNYVSLSKQEVMLNADIFYWNAVSHKEIYNLLVQYRDALGHFKQVIQDRVQEEIVSKSALYQAEVRYNDAQYGVIKAEKQMRVALMELNKLLGVPIDTTMQVADTLAVVNWVKATGDIINRALSQRPELNMLKSQITLNEYKEKITASKYNPALGVGVGGLWGAPSPGLNINPAFNYNLQARLTVPIFYWGKKKEEVAAMRQETEVTRLEMERTREQITLEAQRSYFELQKSQEQLDFSLSALENASKNVSLMIDRYDEGLASVLEVLDAQLYWQKSYFNYIQAKYQLNTAFSNYQRALGELVVK